MPHIAQIGQDPSKGVSSLKALQFSHKNWFTSIVGFWAISFQTSALKSRFASTLKLKTFYFYNLLSNQCFFSKNDKLNFETCLNTLFSGLLCLSHHPNFAWVDRPSHWTVRDSEKSIATIASVSPHLHSFSPKHIVASKQKPQGRAQGIFFYQMEGA